MARKDSGSRCIFVAKIDRRVYRPDGSRIPGRFWVERPAAKPIRSEQDPRWKKSVTFKDPKQAMGVHTRFLHGQVVEPKQTGASGNDYSSLPLSMSGGGVGSG